MDPRLQMLRRQGERPQKIETALLEALERGEIELKDALSLESTHIELLRERGFALLEGGHPDRARAIFELLLLLEGEDPATALVLACCYEQSGDPATARALLSCGTEDASGASPELRQAALEWSAQLFVEEGAVR